MPFLKKTLGSQTFKRVLTTWILVAMVSTQIFRVDLSQSSAAKEHYSVVAILVDETIYSDPTDYIGLSDEYTSLNSTTLKARIDRYAELVQGVMPMTKALIIRTRSDEKPENIMQALQTLYFEGDGSEDMYTQLSGVILIGDLPIPVVNKGGNRYPSLYPYTDYEDSAYLFNATSGDFEPSPQVKNPQPEVWHGVIRSPVFGSEGNEFLASYLDKNYLYRQGNPDFSEFDQKLFYGDTLSEKDSLSDTSLDAYQRFIDNFENIAYYRYTSELAQELYTEVYGSVNGGDGVDNDEDGLIDEDPVNGYDDDYDGLIDEDDGNFNYGIDNDRDCWAQPSGEWDSDGDGKPCDLGDNFVDEDTPDDNNNDGDLLTDEDEPGDNNGDGCAGACETDEDGDQADWDGDGWPNSYEIEILDSDPTKKRSPFWYKAKHLDDSDKRYLHSMYTDEEFPTYDPYCWNPYSTRPEPSAYFDGTLTFQPNNTDRNGDICRPAACESDMSNDDDEDGLCDEDTSDDNDADNDGLTDEDLGGDPDEGDNMFEQLPDIQSKSVIESFFKKYPSIFKKFIGNSNDLIDYTGRYQSSYQSKDKTLSDRDTFVSLIGLRDEYALKVLRAANDVMEATVDELVEDVAHDFPMIGRVTISGDVTTTEDDTASFEFRFINHSVKDSLLSPEIITIYGQTADEISSVGECSLYRGSYDEGGENQLVKGLRVWDYSTAGAWDEENDDGHFEGVDYGGCYGSFAETPQYCFPEVAEVGVRSRTGTMEAQEALALEPGNGDASAEEISQLAADIHVDYRSCYNFKEEEGLLGGDDGEGYLYYAENFLDGYADLQEKLDEGGDDEDSYDESDYEAELQEIIDDLHRDGAYDIPVPDVDDLYLYGEAGDDVYLTLGAFFTHIGINKDSQEEIGGFFANDTTAYTFDHGEFDDIDIESVTFTIEKEFIKEDSGLLSSNLTETESDALEIPSVLKHVEPTVTTINKQVTAGFSQALPVDNPRFITFQDRDYDYQRIDYPNIFAASNYEAFVSMLAEKQTEITETVPGASGYDGFLTSLLGTEMFEDQLRDVFEWQSLNVDQKHQWVLEHYLNPDAMTFVGKVEDGYEALYLVADGDSGTLNMSFNANAVGDDPDLEFNGEPVPASIDVDENYDVNDPDSGHPSLFPFVWMFDIMEWVKSLTSVTATSSPSSFTETSEDQKKSEEKYGCLEEQTYCSNETDIKIDSDSDGISDDEDPAPYSMDNNDDGIPDGATDTALLSLSSNVGGVLGANGTIQVALTVKALDADGNPNADDNYSNVQLEIVSGEESVQIFSVDGATFVNGETILKIATTFTPGTFSLRAFGVSENIDEVYSNTLTFTSKNKFLDLATYEKKFSSQDTVYTTETLADVLILDASGQLVASVHANNGEIKVVDSTYALEARLATLDLPTREVLIKEGSILASFYLIPDTKQVVLNSALSDLAGAVNDVRVIDSNNADDWIAQARDEATSGGGVEILFQEQKVGLVLPNGEVFAKPGFSVSLQPAATLSAVTNPHIHLTFNIGENVLFDVVIGSETSSLEMEGLSEEGMTSLESGQEEFLFAWESDTRIHDPRVLFLENANKNFPSHFPKISSKTFTPSSTNHLLSSLKNFFFDVASAASDFLDTDGDTLDDLSEWTIGTDFTKTDTDGDNYSDGEELNNGYNPLSDGSLFIDLPATHEAYSSVLELYLRGIVSGYEDGSFKPDKPISREEFTKLNLGVVCTDCTNYSDTAKTAIEEQYSTDPFPDTNIDPNLYYCVAESRNRGLISGYKAGIYLGYYLPTNPMSRAEATKVLLKTAGIDFVETADSNLPWYFYAIVKAQANALYPQGRFTPMDSYSNTDFQKWLATELTYDSAIKNWLENPITRGEFAMMVNNTLKKEDCRMNDVDGDGLSDNAELYNFGTNPYNPDTDFGGVNDFIEILNGTNAVSDPSDDYGDTGDQGTPGDTPENLTTDSDEDGLTDAEEAVYGTDPFNPDTDNGGVGDFEEIARGSDPLNAEDDFPSGDGQDSSSGAYVSGDYLSRDSVYETQTLTDSQLIEEKVFTKLVPADGTSQLFLRATIVDETGELITEDNSSIVEFSAIDPAYPYAEIMRTSVRVTDGVAETELKASTTSGYFVITARITPDELPVLPATVYVYPGDPVSMTLQSDSSYMKTGGLNTAQITLTLYDSYGNIASMSPQDITLTLTGPSTFEQGLDEDVEQGGTQITVFEGKTTFNIISGEEEGVATIQAALDEGAVNTSLDMGVYDGIQLVLSSANETLNADGVSTTTLTVKAVLGDSDAPLPGFNGEVTFSLLDTTYGTLPEDTTVTLEDGQAEVDFTTNTLAGTAFIGASMVGLEPASLALVLLPGPTTALKLSSDLTTIATGGDALVYIKAYDQYENFATNDSSTTVDLRLTDLSSSFGSLKNNSITLGNGQGQFTVSAGDLTGPINIVASAFNAETATITLNSVMAISAESMTDLEPNVLFAALLGAPFGEVTQENFLGGWFTFEGKTEASLSLLSDPTPNARLAEVSFQGKVGILDGNAVTIDVRPSNGKTLPVQFFIKDFVTKQTLLEGAVIPATTNNFYLVDSSYNLSGAEDDGFYIQSLFSDSRYELRETKNLFTPAFNGGTASGVISLLENQNEIVRFEPDGQIQIYDSNYALTLNEDYDSFAFDVTLAGTPLLTVLWKQTFKNNVAALDDDFDWDQASLLDPGVYYKGIQSETYGFATAYSGNSSTNPKGIFVTNKTQELSGKQKPGLGFTSIESADTSPGIGFEGDNKFMLLLSDGETVGEANMYYASDIGVVLGDPTIRLTDSNAQDVHSTGFTSGVGRLILAGPETIQDLSVMDYNSDGLEDALVAFEDGVVQVLENTNAYPRFRDRGPLLDISNGIVDMTQGDFNNDGQTDLIVATEDACIQGEVCVYLYTNYDAQFIRQNLDLSLDGNTLKQLVAEDLNLDGYPDLLVSDLNGTIVAFYNREGTFLTEGDEIGNVGMKVDAGQNLINEVLVHYDGMPEDDPNSMADDGNFTELPTAISTASDDASQSYASALEDLFSSTSSDPSFSAGGFSPNYLGDTLDSLTSSGSSTLQVTLADPELSSTEFYIYANEDENFINSTKTASDVNGDIVENGDTIEYRITLTNSSSSTASGLALSDGVSGMLTLDFDSFECDGSCAAMKISETGMDSYPFVANNLSLGAGESTTIIYQGTIDGVSTPAVNIFTGQDLDSGFPNDDYVDIGASPENNPSGQMIFFYSNGRYRDDSIDKINYTKQTSSAEDAVPTSLDSVFKEMGIDLGDLDANGNPNAFHIDKDAEEPPAAANDVYLDAITPPSDNELNPLSSSFFTPVENPADIMANAEAGILLADAVVSELADNLETLLGVGCSGGCIASPINYAALVPGPINLLGVPVVPMDPLHIPVFAAPVPSIFPLWPISPFWQASTAVRIYVSITLTLGTTLSVCVGPYLLGFCWTVSLPLSSLVPALSDLCSAINGAVSNAISKANAFIAKGKDKVMSLAGGGGQESNSEHGSGGGLVNYNLGSYVVASGGTTRSMVKGFPAPFTEWLRKQGEEIINKLRDFPDIYVYYPDPSSFIGAFIPDTDILKDADIRGLEKIISFMNSFPLLRIETQEVVFKFPALTNEEIEKLKMEWSLWLENEWKQVESVADHWVEAQYAEVMNEIKDMLKDVEKNIEILEDYKDFPRELLTWRNAQAFYAKQIICYLDAFIQYLGGWVATNQKRVEQWVEAIHDIVVALTSWKALFQLALDFQESCDQCKNQRFSLFELLLKLFAFIPEPPIIQFPKWPDIVIDFSQIQMGITIVWPQIKFVPEPLKIPSLPVFVIPEIPTLDLNIPDIPVLPALPPLPALPALPSLTLPDLPDLPPPPAIPGLSVSLEVILKIASSILKILCLLQSGILPVQETFLKTQVENMTQRPLDPLLPIDLSINFPPLSLGRDLVDLIEVIGVLNLEKGMKFDQLVQIVQAAANVSNAIVTDLVEAANEAAQQAADAIQETSDAATDALEDTMDSAADTVEGALDEVTGENNDDVTDAGSGGFTINDESGFNEMTPYLNNAFLRPYLDQWTQAVNSFSEETALINSQSAEVPDAYILRATSSSIAFTEEEVNSQFTSLQGQYYAGTLEISPDVPLSSLRNDLLGYLNEEEQKNDLFAANLNQSPDNQWDTMMAWVNSDSPQSYTPSSNFLVSSTLDDQGATHTLYSTEALFEQARQEFLNSTASSASTWVDNNLDSAHDMLTSYLADSSESDSSSSSDYAEARSAPEIINKGLFLYNEDTGVNERLIDYTGEADQPSQLAFIDMENDSDNDILYSYGGNVYLKENYTETVEPTYYDESPQITSLEDLLPTLPAISLYRATDSNNDQASISWKNLDLLNDSTLLGYEAKSYLSLPDFENSEPERMYWDVFLPVDAPLTASLSGLSLDGTVTISGSSYSKEDVEAGTLNTDSLTSGTLLQTEEGGSMTLSYGNDATFTMNESTRFPIPLLEAGFFFLKDLSGDALLPEGNLERTLVNESGETSLTPGDQIHSIGDASFTLTPAEGGSIEIELSANRLMTASMLYPDPLTLRVNDGSIEIIRQNTLDETQPLYEGMLIFPEENISFTDGVTIAYTSASIEEKNSIQLISLFNTNDNDSDSTFSMNYEGPITWTAHELLNSDSPTFALARENGNYYSSMHGITTTGARGLFGETILLSPQVCGDEDSPYANAGSTEEDVSVFKTITLDGSASFDSSGDIKEYYWDLDITHDSDGDGDPTNDADYYHDINPLLGFHSLSASTNDRDDPTYTAGPYDSVDSHNFNLWVKDEAGNASNAEVTVTVYVPAIALSAAAGRTGTVEGNVDPVVSELPFVLARERDGVFELITTPSADSNGLYYTDENGEFMIDDLVLSDAWIIYNSENEAVAQVDLDTGALSILAEGYSIQVYSAELPWPTRVALVDPGQNPLLFIFIVPDSNVDVQIDPASTQYTAETVTSMAGVHVQNVGLPDGYSLEPIPASAPLFTGGVAVINPTLERVAVIDSDGNIYRLFSTLELGVLNESSVSETADSEGAEPIVITLGADQTQWLHIYISPEESSQFTTVEALGLDDEAVNPLNGQDLSSLDTDQDGIPDLEELRNGLNPYDATDVSADADGDGLSNFTEYGLGTNLNASDSDEDGRTDSQEVGDGTDPLDPVDSYFEDIPSSDPLYEDILELVQLGAVEGYETASGHYFKPDQLITRAEYTKVILTILCITPRPEAYLAPSVFNDIPYSETDLAWYYAITKEAYLQGFIVGYLGEKDAGGMTPFKPDISISRAEGTKIILEVLESLGVIDMGDVVIPTDAPWYVPYMQMAQDLTDYLISDTTLGEGKPFIITSDEASRATEALTRYEFMKMAVRVLDFYNCYADQDSDGDGLSDYEEVNVYGSDPYDADTDKGGIFDGEEVAVGTDPMDRNDDDSDGDSLVNADEIDLYDTDPFDPDTDDGGTYDGVEVLQGTNPTDDPSDDAGVTDQPIEETLLEEENVLDGLEPGITVVTYECMTCPCPTSIENMADLDEGDSLYSAIMNADKTEVLSISPSVKIEEILGH